MAYTKQTWQDSPNTTTPITAARLSHIEDGIEANSEDIETLSARVANTVDYYFIDAEALIVEDEVLDPHEYDERRLDGYYRGYGEIEISESFDDIQEAIEQGKIPVLRYGSELWPFDGVERVALKDRIYFSASWGRIYVTKTGSHTYVYCERLLNDKANKVKTFKIFGNSTGAVAPFNLASDIEEALHYGNIVALCIEMGNPKSWRMAYLTSWNGTRYEFYAGNIRYVFDGTSITIS